MHNLHMHMYNIYLVWCIPLDIYICNITVTRSTYFGVCALIIDAPSQHIVLRDKVVSELTSHLCIINWSEIQYGTRNSIGATKYQTIIVD
jgi:hypothetical protein